MILLVIPFSIQVSESFIAMALMLFISYLLSSRSFLGARQKDVISVVVPTLVFPYLVFQSIPTFDDYGFVDAGHEVAKVVYLVFSLGFSWHAMRSSHLVVWIVGNIYSLVLGCITVFVLAITALEYTHWECETNEETSFSLAFVFGVGWLVYVLIRSGNATRKSA